MNSRMNKNYALGVLFALATIEPVSATPLTGLYPDGFSAFAGEAAIDGAGSMINARNGAIDSAPDQAWTGLTGGMESSMAFANGIAMPRVADAAPAPDEVGEPATILLLGAGIGMIAFFVRRR